MRILRPGGSFLFADLIDSAGGSEDAVSVKLSKAGLIIEDRIDITENVLAARDAVSRSPSFRSRVQERVPWQLVLETEDLLYLTGTRSYAEMTSRQNDTYSGEPRSQVRIPVTETAEIVIG